MAIVEIILGERPPTGVQTPIEYSVLSEDFCTTINGELVREPVAPLRERFAKLKARDNLLGAVLARLELGPNAGEDHAVAVLDRWLTDKKSGDVWNDKLCATLTKIAKGLGLRDGGAMMKPDELADQVLAMNTELTAALAKAEAKRDEAIAEAINECKGRAAAEAEVRKLTAALHSQADDTRAAKAEIEALKLSLEVRELERVLACARVAGLAVELQEFERAMREKLRV